MLCVDKTQQTYDDIFKALLQLEPDIKPEHIIFDFERAIINAAAENFPNAELHGCNFHFGQAIWRHVQSVGLQAEYAQNTTFQQNIKTLMALAFVPPENVVAAFEALVRNDFWVDNEESPFNAEKQNLLSYFESTYIGSFARFTQTRKNPLFAHKLWNMYDCTKKRKFLLMI